MASSPLDELPDLRLHRSRLADLSEERHGALQVTHGLVLAARRTQQVREVVVERSLPVEVSDGRGFAGGLARERDRALVLAGATAGEREVVQSGDTDARVADALGERERALEMVALAGQDPTMLCACASALVARTLGQRQRLAGQPARVVTTAAVRGEARGPGVFKIDYALDGPIPWRAAECARAGTVHVGGTFEEVAASEAQVARGQQPERPFLLVAQQSLFDPTRAPAGKHTAWVYCHVPCGSTFDMTERIESQLERHAPGFRDRVLARAILTPALIEKDNANNAGGDISNGSHAGLQLFAPPVLRIDPYATPVREMYLCSAATPPGAGVHRMCGYNAARSALRRSLS